MDYRTFADQVIEKVIENTGLDEERVYFQEADESVMGDGIIVVFGEGANEYYCCRFYAQEMYKEYQSGCSVERIVDKIREEIFHAKEINMKEKIEQLRDFEKAKDHLFVRLLNYDKNIDKLKDTVYRLVGDIALAVYVKISADQGGVMSSKVDRNLVKIWGKADDMDTVFREAMDNTLRITPPRVYRFDKMLLDPEGYKGEDFMGVMGDFLIHRGPLGNPISTEMRTNGASIIFVKGVAQRLSDIMCGDDLYLVFTSIHEVIVHSTASTYPDDLERILMETIMEATPEEDFVTRHIYKYSRKEDRIFMLPLSGEQAR